MDRRRPPRIVAIAILLLAASMSSLQPVLCEDRPKIAIIPFDFRKRSSTGVDVGREMARLIAARINDTGCFTIVQSDSSSASPAPYGIPGTSQAVEIGRRLDADAVLVGTVQDFDLVLNTGPSGGQAAMHAVRSAASYAPYGAGAIAGVFGAMSANMANRGKVKALIDVKLVDTTSGDTILTLGGAGESKRTATTLWDHRQNFADFTSSDFNTTAAGEAAYAAVEPVCAQLIAAASRIAGLARSYKVLGAVSDIDDALVCVNVGKENGLIPGDNLSIDRPSTPVMPGQKIRVGRGLTAPVGTLILSNVGANSAIGTLSGNAASVIPHVGDFIRKATVAEAITLQAQPLDSPLGAQGSSAPAPGALNPGGMIGTEIVPRSSTTLTDYGANTRYTRGTEGSPYVHKHHSSSSTDAWQRFRDNGIKFYNSGNYSAARSMFMAALRFSPPPDAISEIANYLKDIDSRSR